MLRKPEVQWLDVKRQKQEDLPLQAKFYARVEPDGLFYGIHIPVQPPESAETTDWQVIMDWLAKPENDAWLKKQCLAHELSVRDLDQKGFGGTLTPGDEQWMQSAAGEEASGVGSLGAFLSDAGKKGELNLRIEKFIPKDAVVEKKKAIADDLAALFESLMPMYAAVAESSRQ